MRRTTIAISVLSVLLTINVKAEENTAELEQQQISSHQANRDKYQDFYDYLNDYLDEYETWRDAYSDQVDKEKARLIQQWGEGLLSDQSIQVNYSHNNTVRSLIDYENNTATVSVLINKGDTPTDVLKLIETQSKKIDRNTQIVDKNNGSSTFQVDFNISAAGLAIM